MVQLFLKLYQLINPTSNHTFLVLRLYIPNIFYITGTLVFIYLNHSYSIMKMVNSPESRNFYLPIHYVFKNDDISVKSQIGNEVMKWDAFVKWRKFGQHYLLFYNMISFTCIPREQIPPENINDFEKLLSEKIG